MSKPFAPRSNNYLTAGRPFPKQQSLIHTTANSLRYPSSNSSYSLKNERKEQSVNKGPITKNSISTENNSHPANLERCSKDIDSPNRIFTMHDSIQRSGTENNSCSSNTKKCSKDVENLSNRSSAIHNPNSVENNSRSITIRKNSIEVENSSENSTTYSSNNVKNFSRPVNLRKSSTGVQDPSMNSAINHSRPTNLKKSSIETENSSRISTTHITKRSSEVENLRRSSNNFNGMENNLLPKKRSAEVENNANHPKKYSKVEGPNVNSTIHSRPTNIRKPSIEAENSNRISTTHIAKRPSEVENLRRNSTNNPDSVENNSRANHPKKNSKVEDSSVNSTTNQSRPINLKKSSMKAENSRRISTTRIFTAKRFSEVENPRRNSTTINLDSVGSMEVDNNANHPKQRPEVENPSRRITIHNPVQRDSTKNNIRTTNRSVNLVRRNGTSNNSLATNPQHSRKPVNSLLPVGLDRFSSQALNKKVKNKELSKSEWESIRLIKAALINLVELSQKYRKIESGKFAWSKINEWVYNTFYPDLNEYLDKMHINRENADLVIKAIMDYYVSRHDRYMKQVRKTK